MYAAAYAWVYLGAKHLGRKVFLGVPAGLPV
jgi:hypothetical protein